MIDLNTIRAEFASRLSADSTRFSMDAALAHVVEMVNAGVSVAVKLAQIVAGVTPDGKAGPKTAAALNAVDPATFKTAYTLAKITRYVEIVGKDRSQERFLLGWMRRSLAGLKGHS